MAYGSRTLLAAALVCFGLWTGFGPGPAHAQTATDLKCKGCVNGKTIKKGAVKFNRLQGKVQNRITDLESVAQQRVPFYITLDGDGAEQTIVTNGPLEYFARCRVNDGGGDRVEIVGTSSIPGWFANSLPSGPGGPLAAFQEVVFLQVSEGTGSTVYFNGLSETTMAAPDGSFIAIDGDLSGLAINLFGHNCVAIGTAILVNGTP